jgi:hypothetical protein
MCFHPIVAPNLAMMALQCPNAQMLLEAIKFQNHEILSTLYFVADITHQYLPIGP